MQDKNKIRIRSDNELKMQNHGLEELSQILSSNKIKHYITGGTLLGAIREKNLVFVLHQSDFNETVVFFQDVVVASCKLVDCWFQK